MVDGEENRVYGLGIAKPTKDGFIEKFIEKPGSCVFICAVKILLEIPTFYFVFLQRENFYVAVASLLTNYLVVSGWVTLTLKMLMIVLPKEITGVTNSLFLIL